MNVNAVTDFQVVCQQLEDRLLKNYQVFDIHPLPSSIALCVHAKYNKVIKECYGLFSGQNKAEYFSSSVSELHVAGPGAVKYSYRDSLLVLYVIILIIWMYWH